MLLSLMFGATSVRAQGRPASPDSEVKTESSMQAGSTGPSTANLTCQPTTWGGRLAYVLENDIIHLVALTGGGHIAEFRFREESGLSKINPLWTPPWNGIEPYLYRENVHAAKYGAPPTGQLLSGIAGHNLCLDYFGGPSNEEAKQGLPIHGEAGISLWHSIRAEAKGQEAILEMSVKLPVAGLSFTRQIRIRHGESVAYFKEEVVNEKKADHFFHWTQHATLGPPFLSHEHSRIFISATRGRTFPHGYEGKELLATAQDFRWPNAPGVNGTPVDLRRPLSHPGLGFVATVLMDPDRYQQYVAGLNIPDRLLVGYCFDRKDFPWTAIWEENKARADAPWNGQSETRGLEFGSTPLPVGRREAFADGPLFGAPCFYVVPALGHATVRYAAFLTQVPAGLDDVADIRLANGAIHVVHSAGTIPVPASGVSKGGMITD